MSEKSRPLFVPREQNGIMRAQRRPGPINPAAPPMGITREVADGISGDRFRSAIGYLRRSRKILQWGVSRRTPASLIGGWLALCERFILNTLGVAAVFLGHLQELLRSGLVGDIARQAFRPVGLKSVMLCFGHVAPQIELKSGRQRFTVAPPLSRACASSESSSRRAAAAKIALQAFTSTSDACSACL